MARTASSAWTASLLLCAVIVEAHAQGVERPPADDSDVLVGPPDMTAPLPRALPPSNDDSGALPIDWPTVLELARASNLEIQLAFEKVNEAHVQVDLARLQWIPSLKVGSTWLNSAGRRQDIPGPIIEASKSSLFSGALAEAQIDLPKVAVDVLRARQQVFARSGELDRVTRAEVQKVSNAYIDLVAAQAGAAISVELSQLIRDLVERTQQLKDQGFGTDVDVLSSRVNLQSQLQREIQAKQGQLAASAQLVMLLHMDPSTRLVANWEHLAPITLVDESQSEEELIQQALAQGPGVAEVATLLSALDEQQRQLRRIGLVPTVSITSGLGAFGGGEGSTLGDFGDRTDVGVSAYWDVLKIMGTKHTREMFASKRRQAVLEQQKLESRLAAGVKVARSRAVEARKMIREAEVEVDLAIQRYALSKKRMEAGLLQMPALEMLPAIGILGAARANYLQAVIEFNKAQVELMYLLGRHVPEATYLEPNCPPRRYVDGRLVPGEPSNLMPVEAVAEEPATPVRP